MNRFWLGAAEGLTATVAMTVLMKTWRARLPRRQRYALPPRQIATETLQKANAVKHLDPAQRTIVANVAHYTYGAAAAVGYELLFGRRRSALGPSLGFGLALWAIGYLGWLPLLNYRAAATREPRGRSLMMIAAHLLWSFVVGRFHNAALNHDSAEARARRRR